MSITSVPAAIGKQIPGQLAYRSDDFLRTYSGVLYDANAVAPGLGLIQDATNNSVKLPTAGTGGAFVGVAIDDGTLPIETAAYVTGKVIPYVDGTRGVVVKTAKLMAIGDDVFLTDTAAGTGAIGTFTNDVDGGKATKITAGVKWCEIISATAAVLTINKP